MLPKTNLHIHVEAQTPTLNQRCFFRATIPFPPKSQDEPEQEEMVPLWKVRMNTFHVLNQSGACTRLVSTLTEHNTD